MGITIKCAHKIDYTCAGILNNWNITTATVSILHCLSIPGVLILCRKNYKYLQNPKVTQDDEKHVNHV